MLPNTFHIFFFIFLMIRRPPRSTPFPTRRSSDLLEPLLEGREVLLRDGQPARGVEHHRVELLELLRRRSEEHTSELQSHSDLVCRLLLEKKKNKITY